MSYSLAKNTRPLQEQPTVGFHDAQRDAGRCRAPAVQMESQNS